MLGADSVIDINGELISKPNDRNEALKILKYMFENMSDGKFLIKSINSIEKEPFFADPCSFYAFYETKRFKNHSQSI